tara:strand:+ start:2225 stop:4732 length:2508 start_codon:yes stop_codon:yes gene_type:complete
MTIEKELTDAVKVPTDVLSEEVELEAQDLNPSDQMNIEMMEDGGAEIDFDPEAEAMQGAEQHDANLVDFLDDAIIGELSSEILAEFDECDSSRSEWEQTYKEGLELLGFKYENRSEPFQGASGATHPVLAEAVTQFQALAYKELLPADGPVRTQVMGLESSEKVAQAARVKDFMNYQLMVNMKEYEPEFDQMLFNLPLSGSTFKKVYYDAILQRSVSKFVPAEDLYVPYTATSLDDTETIIHRVKMTHNDLVQHQLAGIYSMDAEIGDSGTYNNNDVQEQKNKLDGTETNKHDVHSILECHVHLEIEGFEDINPETEESTGMKFPYIVTIEEDTGEVLAIKRNWKVNDQLKKRQDYFVHFKFLPGLGFYGFGLIHMIGGLSRTATAALRQLLDAGTLSNLPAGFKMRGIRVRDEAQPLQPGEFRDVDAPGGNLRDAFMPLPFKGPDATLLQLMGTVVQAGQRFASIADMQVGDGNQGAAVGTTVALLERGSRVMSAIHKRLYAAMKCEFMLLADNFVTYLPNMYPYDVVGGQNQIFKDDFSAKVDIVPVADPNIFSQTQRISIAQSEMQIAMTNPQMHNIYHAYRHMYEALGVKDIDQLLPPPPQPSALDPASENILALNGKKFQAFPKQDHQSHMKTHLRFMGTTVIRNNPAAMGMLQQNCMEHILLMATEQVEIEFAQQKQQMEQVMQQVQPLIEQAQQNPQMQQQLQQDPKMQQIQQQETNLQMQMEARKSQLIAEFSDDFAEAEKEVLNQVENDPLLKLKDRELDLKAREEQARQEEAEEKINLERAKMMQSKELAEDKMEQNDEHQKLRASVSLAKDGIKNMQATIKSGN